jgi:hypothetical protein
VPLWARRIDYRLLAILGVAAIVRLWFFTGLALGDDVIYAPQSMVFALGKGWPPQPYHWCTRIGLTVPTAVVIALVGRVRAAFVALPFAASLASVWLSYRAGRDVFGARFAGTAGFLHAFYPLEVVFATHLFPDLPVGVLSAAGIYVWWRSLRSSSVRSAVWSGVLVGAAYLVRETAVICIPVFLALLIYERPRNWLTLATACAAPAVLVLVAESSLYGVTTGDPLYRLRSVTGQLDNPLSMEGMAMSTFGGGFWMDPLLMTVTSQDFGPFMLIAIVAIIVGARDSRLIPFALWLVVGFAWTFYGTTVPWRWQPLMRDPRYVAFVTVPVIVLSTSLVDPLRPGLRNTALVILASLGICCAALDQGPTVRVPHAALLQESYLDQLTLEPFEYYGAWWEHGLNTPPPFFFGTDAGRQSMVVLFRTLTPTQARAINMNRYFALSVERRPDLYGQLLNSGWTVHRVIPGQPRFGRAIVGRLLRLLPTQRERAERILHPAGLVVLENPTASAVMGRQSAGRLTSTN